MIINWNHLSADAICTSNDPQLGGIIDKEIVSGKWFVIFNCDLQPIENLATKQDAIEAHEKAIKEKYWIE